MFEAFVAGAVVGAFIYFVVEKVKESRDKKASGKSYREYNDTENKTER